MRDVLQAKVEAHRGPQLKVLRWDMLTKVEGTIFSPTPAPDIHLNLAELADKFQVSQ